jgi:hypothetical protein
MNSHFLRKCFSVHWIYFYTLQSMVPFSLADAAEKASNSFKRYQSHPVLGRLFAFFFGVRMINSASTPPKADNGLALILVWSILSGSLLNIWVEWSHRVSLLNQSSHKPSEHRGQNIRSSCLVPQHHLLQFPFASCFYGYWLSWMIIEFERRNWCINSKRRDDSEMSFRNEGHRTFCTICHKAGRDLIATEKTREKRMDNIWKQQIFKTFGVKAWVKHHLDNHHPIYS